MTKCAREVLTVPYGTEFWITYPARSEKNVLGPDGEVFRRDDKAVLLRLNTGHRAIRDDRRFAVSQKIAENMNDRRRLSVGRKHSRVGHPAHGHVQRTEK